MKKGILHIQLMNRPVAREGQGQHGANGGWLDNRTESLRKINPGTLSEPSKHPSRFVALQRTVGIELVLEYPFASNNISPSRTWYEIPRIVGQERIKFLLHSPAPIWISKSAPVGAGHWGQWGGLK